MIADDREVESLAGIMGGDATAVSDDTRNVYVEAAFWWPAGHPGPFAPLQLLHRCRAIASSAAWTRARRSQHIEHITRLILEICGGEAGPMDDQVVRLPEHKPVSLRVARAAKVIGMPVTEAQCRGRLVAPGPGRRPRRMAC